jgi:broad specificity phosphatase PhoE
MLALKKRNQKRRSINMVNLYFVRHGEASSSWDKSTDPGLSELGHRQAAGAAETLANEIGVARLVSSPLARAQETAIPLSKKWGATVQIEPNIAEIPSAGIPFEERRTWLNGLMASHWEGQAEPLLRWRSGILEILKSQSEDTIFFTHFMVLNVIVGALENSEKIVSFRPDNCAITKVGLTEDGLKLLEKGREAVTVVR